MIAEFRKSANFFLKDTSMNFTFNKCIKFILFLTFSLSTSQIMSMQPQEPVKINWDGWKNTLLNSPRASLALARSTKGRFQKFIQEHSVDTNKQGLFYLYSLVICPFFLMDECSNDTCPLSRGYGCKEIFEEEISKKLIAIIDANPGRTINYVGFGSYTFFSDLLIITRALQARPNANIKIYAVDLIYGMPCAKKDGVFARQQFLDCIKGMFPQATFDIVLIDNAKMNPVQLAASFNFKPDILVGADVECLNDDPDFEPLSYYDQLLRQMINSNQFVISSIYAWLNGHGVGIFSYAGINVPAGKRNYMDVIDPRSSN